MGTLIHHNIHYIYVPEFLIELLKNFDDIWGFNFLIGVIVMIIIHA